MEGWEILYIQSSLEKSHLSLFFFFGLLIMGNTSTNTRTHTHTPLLLFPLQKLIISNPVFSYRYVVPIGPLHSAHTVTGLSKAKSSDLTSLQTVRACKNGYVLFYSFLLGHHRYVNYKTCETVNREIFCKNIIDSPTDSWKLNYRSPWMRKKSFMNCGW